MGDKVGRWLRGAGYALLIGAVAGVGLGAFVFLFAFVASGLDAMLGVGWVRRTLYVLASVGIVAGGVGMVFGGREYEGSPLGLTREIEDPVNAHEDPRSVLTVPGVSWPVAVVWASVGMLVVATVLDLVA